MTHKWRFRRLGALAIALLALVGCVAGPTPQDALKQFSELPGIIQVAPHKDSATLTVSATSPDSEVLKTVTSVVNIARAANWEGEVTLEREFVPLPPNADGYWRDPWSLTVFPARKSTLGDLKQLLLLEKLDPFATLTVVDGWPTVDLGGMNAAADYFRVLAANELFAKGGTVRVGEDHLRIEWVPERTSIRAIEAVLVIANAFAGAEVLLEAPRAGPRWPTLYVSRITPADAASIQTLLLDPSMADADVEGYALPFILRVIGPDGATYIDGNFGGVVED